MTYNTLQKSFSSPNISPIRMALNRKHMTELTALKRKDQYTSEYLLLEGKARDDMHQEELGMADKRTAMTDLCCVSLCYPLNAF